MTNYEKTKIYKIESLLGDKIYIGSTAKEYLSQRFQQHKTAYKGWKNGKGGRVTSYELFDLYGIENCSIVLIEACPCESKDAKNAKESHYIRTMDCDNKVIPNRTQKEYQDSEAGKAIRKKYEDSEAGKAIRKEYEDSEAGKAIRKSYEDSEAGKAVKKSYYQSDVYKAQKKAYYLKCKAIKQANV